MNVDDDAVQQLVALGISNRQAYVALQKYNNDVMRAADYIFSGHAEQDDVEPLELAALGVPDSDIQPTEGASSASPFLVPQGIDASPGSQSDIEDENALKNLTTDDYVANDNTNPFIESETQRAADAVAGPENDAARSFRNELSAEASHNNQPAPSEPSNNNAQQWSLVPYKEQSTISPAMRSENAEDRYSYYNLTWWRDPGSVYRAKIDNIPVGLRPPPYDFSCAPPLLQALYHIPLFRTAIFTYKPTPSDWGSPKNYWRGAGRGIPDNQTTASNESPPDYEQIDQRVTTDMDQLDLERRESQDTRDTPYDSDSDALSENDMAEEKAYHAAKKASNLRVVHELQRLFAFLHYTNRRYVSVTNVVRAAQASSNIGGTELTNSRPEGFLEQLISCAGFDDTCCDMIQFGDKSYKAGSLFTISAVIEMFEDRVLQDETEEEKAFFLVISPDESTFDLHSCLRPLIYETNTGSDSDVEVPKDEDRHRICKITSFTEMPPILQIFLEDPTQYSIGVRTAAGGRNNSYRIEKSIYMDRYLHKNRDRVLQINEDITQAKAKVTSAKDKLNYYNRNCGSHTAIEYLQAARTYFYDNPIQRDVDVIKTVLDQVQKNIDDGNKELEEAEKRLHHVSEAMFKCDGLTQCRYNLHAILMHDGGNGTGHHWAYINAATSSLDPQDADYTWFKCCDASVVACTDEEVFADDNLVYSLIYVDATLDQSDIPNVDDIVPAGLKEHVLLDCTAFENELQPSESFSDSDIDSDGLETGFLEDDDTDLDDPPSISPAVPEVDSETDRSELDEEALLKIQQEEAAIGGDSYKVLESFELFLAKFGEIQSLRYLIANYGSANTPSTTSDTETPSLTPETDPKLKWQYQLYQDYLDVAEQICSGIDMMQEGRDDDALKFLISAKEQAAKWKESLWRGSSNNNIDSLMTGSSLFLTIQKLGKLVLTTANGKAYSKALNPAYRKRGFEDALRISKYAQALLDPDTLEHDPFYSQLQEQWLSFTDTVTGSLDEEEAELFNAVVMSFLEYQGLDQRDLVIADVEQNLKEENLRKPVWQRYKEALFEMEQVFGN
ncbi:hypothetical protein INT43_008979 [Umbelopsis isabellina]|uniref:UBA domain-containing protein n=1 Tax=Mortierella isabellina TaxID=91625 RepID=A0A8H7PYC0_MORIS|nr:hypothetical protein INT43_008979 [Umbelopsis isabellina]